MTLGSADPRTSDDVVATAILVGESGAIRTILRSIRALAPLCTHVLFMGERGTGRRTCAELLHHEGPHRDRPFVAISLRATTETEIAARLFGPRGCAGLAAQARGVTLYIDEVERLSPALQTRLSDVLTDGKSTPGIRVLASTTRSLELGRGFDTDSSMLLDRIGVLQISVPPLRERAADIAPIAAHALRSWNDRHAGAPRRLAHDALAVLAAHSWPGNVRELVDVVHRACARTRARTLTAERFRLMLGRRPRRTVGSDVIPLLQLECEYILHVIARCDGNRSLAAKYLGIERGTLTRRLRTYERRAHRGPS